MNKKKKGKKKKGVFERVCFKPKLLEVFHSETKVFDHLHVIEEILCTKSTQFDLLRRLSVVTNGLVLLRCQYLKIKIVTTKK